MPWFTIPAFHMMQHATSEPLSAVGYSQCGMDWVGAWGMGRATGSVICCLLRRILDFAYSSCRHKLLKSMY